MQKLSLFSLVFLIVAGIDSIRNLPSAALFGSSLIFFFLFSALIFLIPVALLSAEFSSRYSEEGGIFHWVKRAFGAHTGLFAIWLQWINTMVWYPTVLSFLAGTAAYLFYPELAQNKLFLISFNIGVFWFLTVINFKGLHVSAKINTFCCILGTLFPMGLLIGMGGYWAFSGLPIQLSFGFHDLIPTLSSSTNWVSLIAIMSSFLGMELAGVHIRQIDQPQKNYPKAMGISVLIILITMLFGSLAVGLVIPKAEIRLVDGIMQTMTYFFSSFHMGWATPFIAFLIIMGTSGGMINWLISPARGLLQAANEAYLPKWFAKENKEGVPVRLLLIQASLVSFFSILMALMPSINAFYWLLMALSTGLYMIMYILLFAAAYKLKRPKKEESLFQLPKGTRKLFILLGIFGASITIFFGFVPPEGIDVGGSMRYISTIALGNLILIAPAPLLCLYKKRKG